MVEKWEVQSVAWKAVERAFEKAVVLALPEVALMVAKMVVMKEDWMVEMKVEQMDVQ